MHSQSHIKSQFELVVVHILGFQRPSRAAQLCFITGSV